MMIIQGFTEYSELSLASGASTTPAGLPRWGPRSALGSVMGSDL